MIKVFSLALNNKKVDKIYFKLSIGTDFMDEINKFRTGLITKESNFGITDLEIDTFHCRSIDLKEILEAAKTDLKELVEQAKLIDEVNSFNGKV